MGLTNEPPDLLPGTLDLLILKTLVRGSLHGYNIAQRNAMRQLLRRAWYLIRQRRFDADLREEMEFHQAAKQRDLEHRGTDATEARFATRRALGGMALAQDQSRDVWTPRWLQGV